MLDEKQLALRRTGVTGTDIAAICGLSEFRSPLDVWLEKVGKAEPVDITPAMERGIYLESGILDWYTARSGALKVDRCGTLQMQGQPRIMATPDGVAEFKDAAWTAFSEDGTPRPEAFVLERRGVEVKAPGPFMEYGWGKPGTDEVPQSYLCQAVFEMAVLDVERLDFAALLGGELQIYPVARHRGLEGKLIERALAFWRDHVEADKPPAPTWRERDSEWIRKAFPKATQPSVTWDSLTPTQRLQVEEYLAAHKTADDAVKAKTALELQVKLFLGEAGGITGLPKEVAPYTRIDWKENATGSPSWKKVAEALSLGKDWCAAVIENTGSPPRPFVPRKSKKGDE